MDDAVPYWVEWLAGFRCEPLISKWGRWSTPVTTFCVGHAAIHPKRSKKEWREMWRDEYGKPLLRPRDGSGRSVAEFEVVKASERGFGSGARGDRLRAADHAGDADVPLPQASLTAAPQAWIDTLA